METDSILAALAENKWQLVRHSTNNGFNRDVIVRYIPGIMRQELPALISHLKTYVSVINGSTASTTVVNPITTPEGAWNGTWYGGRIWYEKAGDGEPGKTHEGTYNLYQALHKGGDAETAVVTEDGCQYYVTQTWFFEYPTIGSLPSSTSGIQYSMTQPLLNEESGFWTYAIECRTRITQSTLPLYKSERTPFEYDTKVEYKGVYNGDVTNTGTPVNVPDNESPQTPGEIDEVLRTKNSDCTQDINITRKYSVEAANAEKSVVITPFESTSVITDRNETAAETFPTVPPVAADGILKIVEAQINNFAKFDNKVTTKTATFVEDAITEKVVDAFETQETDTQRNKVTAQADVDTQVAGEITAIQNTLNDYNRYDVNRKKRTATTVNDAVIEKTVTQFEKVSIDIDRNATSAVSPVTEQVAGKITTTRSTENEFQRFDNETRAREGINVEDAEVLKTTSKFETVETDLDRNETIAGTPPSQTDGQIDTVESVKNDFQRYDVKTTKRSANAVSNAEQSATVLADETISSTTDRNQLTGATLPSGAISAGTIQAVINALNDFGRYDIRSTTNVATYQSYSTTWPDKYGTAYMFWGHNATENQFETAKAGAVLTYKFNCNVSVQKNKYDLLDYIITKIPYGGGNSDTGESARSGTQPRKQYGYIYDSTAKRVKRKYRTLNYDWSLTWHSTYSAALAVSGTGHEGSRVVQSGGLYGSLYFSAPIPSAWTDDET